MRISPTSVIDYLAGRGHPVSRTASIHEFTRRNHLLLVGERPAEAWLLKQPSLGGELNRTALTTEAAFYRHTISENGWSSSRQFVPRFVDFDPHRCVLVIERLLGFADLVSISRSLGQDASREVANALGSALGTIHQMEVPARLRGQSHGSATPFLSLQKPMVLSLVTGNRTVPPPTNNVQSEIVRCIQHYEAFRSLLWRIDREWTWQTLIHGDLRWENVMSRTGADGIDLRVVDWELVSFGDPAWDVACVLSGFLNQVYPGAESFLEAYAGVAGVRGEARTRFLKKCLRYCGARQLQTAYEAAGVARTFDARAMTALQRCLDLCREPSAVAHELGMEA